MSETKQITAIVTQEDADHVSKIVQAYINYLISTANLITDYIEHRPEFQYEMLEELCRDEMLTFVNQVMGQLDALSIMNQAKCSSDKIRNLKHHDICMPE